MKEEDLQKIYLKNLPLWEERLNDIANTISDILQAEELRFSIKKRVKSIESLNAKKQESANKGLIQNQKIKDLLGLRFVVPFLEDVERIIDVIKESFTAVDIERKSETLSYREFAYDSVHIEISLENPTIELPDFCCQSCEIQIRTILQDAWAEIEHEVVYKSSIEFPDNQAIRKKLAALNASLALSDMIFQEIRDKRKELETWGQERFKELQKRAKKITIDSLPKYQVATEKDDSGKILKKESKKNIEKTLLKALEAHNDKNYRRAIDLYSEALSIDPPLKIRAIIYNHRGLAFFMLNKERQALKDFEDSLTEINDCVGEIIDENQEKAQQVFPHYFEKYRTDGVEYNAYIGQSLVRDLNYDPIYLKNLRLWQLLVKVKVARKVRELIPSLKTKLDVTQLILVHSNPLSIAFRQDEKKFDVAGAYNIRYEITKKRIDKAVIKGTNERITQVGKIAIIYAHAEEKDEYKRYIDYLIAKNYLKDSIEDFELEDLKGASGLRALRVEVNYTGNSEIEDVNISEIKKLIEK